jgi:uncharacterized protein YgfB (UPF0149 family)
MRSSYHSPSEICSKLQQLEIDISRLRAEEEQQKRRADAISRNCHAFMNMLGQLSDFVKQENGEEDRVESDENRMES